MQKVSWLLGACKQSISHPIGLLQYYEASCSLGCAQVHHQSHRVSSAECRVPSVRQVSVECRRVSVECPPSDVECPSSVHRVSIKWRRVSIECPSSDLPVSVVYVTRRSLDGHSTSLGGHLTDTRRHSMDTWRTLDGHSPTLDGHSALDARHSTLDGHSALSTRHSTDTRHSALDTRWDWWCRGSWGYIPLHPKHNLRTFITIRKSDKCFQRLEFNATVNAG